MTRRVSVDVMKGWVRVVVDDVDDLGEVRATETSGFSRERLGSVDAALFGFFEGCALEEVPSVCAAINEGVRSS
jgi:hypothetical protein